MDLKNIILFEPQTPKEFEAYYLLRFEILRKPWKMPAGSEKDELENESIHIMACDENKNILGVFRWFQPRKTPNSSYLVLLENIIARRCR